MYSVAELLPEIFPETVHVATELLLQSKLKPLSECNLWGRKVQVIIFTFGMTSVRNTFNSSYVNCTKMNDLDPNP